jgi:hypothetical protein
MFTRFRIALAGLIVLIFAPIAVAQGVADDTQTEAAPDDFGPMICQGSDRLQWTATADALLLSRSAAGSQQLLFEPHTATELLDATDLSFPFSAGPRLSLRCEDAAGLGVEVTYFGVDGWRSEADFPASSFPFGVGYLSIDNNITVPVNSAQFVYRSRLYSAEANVRYAWSDWLTPLAGFRWVDFEDRYDVSGIENSTSGPFLHSIRSQNHLYGAQIGLDVHPLDRTRALQIDVLTKVGIYGNAAAQSNKYADPVFAFAASAAGSQVSFLGEIGVNASYQLTPHIAVRGGYQVMWLTGMALAPDQISATDFAGQTAVNSSGTLFCHGAHAGLEVTW